MRKSTGEPRRLSLSTSRLVPSRRLLELEVGVEDRVGRWVVVGAVVVVGGAFGSGEFDPANQAVSRID